MRVKHRKKRFLLFISLLVVTYTCLQLKHCLHHSIRPSDSQRNFANAKSIYAKEKLQLKWKPQIDSTSPNGTGLLIYNRLPKCASTVTRMLIAHLQNMYPDRFVLKVDSKPHIKQVLNKHEQKQLVSALSSLSQSTVYVRHMRFLDFTKFHRKRPSYMNIIRDPVEQFISAYYFNRFGFVGWSEEKVKKWLSHKPDKERYMSLEQCIMENVTRCVEQNSARYFSYFCGHENECNDNDKWSLERAKENVEEHYAVVGIAEQYEDTLWLLEKCLPRYFANLSTLYQNVKEFLPVTKTARKINPSAIAKQKLKEALRLRIEFYEFINGRFSQQLSYHRAKTKINF